MKKYLNFHQIKSMFNAVFLYFSCQPHRVLIPEEETKRDKPRRSIVLFFDPDKHTVITCLDGSDKYPPVISEDYVLDILKKTYKF